MIPTPAQATGRGPCSEDRYEVTHSMDKDLRRAKMRSLIRCVFDAVGIGGQVSTAIAVADRESSWTPWATNPDVAGACRPWSSNSFGSCGLFQMISDYWPGRARALPDRYFPNDRTGVLQPRANVWASALLVRRSGGWCHWTAPNYCG